MFRRLILLTSALAISGCTDIMTSPARVSDQAAEISATTSLEQIALTSSDTINDGKFTALGDISTSVGKATIFGKTPTRADGELKLRIEAVELGADAVINARVSDVTICALSWGCRNISGTAVAYPD